MKVKTFEIRDSGTFIEAVAVQCCDPCNDAEAFLLGRAGYILLDKLCLFGRLDGTGKGFNYDPYEWGDRTMHVAHEYVAAHWDELESGEVIDVEYILGERPVKKESERV